VPTALEVVPTDMAAAVAAVVNTFAMHRVLVGPPNADPEAAAARREAITDSERTGMSPTGAARGFRTASRVEAHPSSQGGTYTPSLQLQKRISLALTADESRGMGGKRMAVPPAPLPAEQTVSASRTL
jgi:hypothetical protein